MPLHLRPKDELRGRGFDGGFHLQVVVGDQRFQTQGLRRSPQGRAITRL